MDFELQEDKSKKPKWWQRLKKNINTETIEKLETPDGIWFKCPKCSHTEVMKDFEDNLWICNKCSYHSRINSRQYFDILFDEGEFTLHFEEVLPSDPLQFVDEQPYPDKVAKAQKKTGLTEALSVGSGKIEGQSLVVACMDFSFIGGSMGSVVGERIARGIDLAIQTRSAFMIISKSGGARMMESAFSLMQMAKTAAKLTQLSEAKLPYISLLTDPTTGGVSTSYAMLGDLNIAEPKAMIGFAGPRVVKETIKKELPKNFQTAESLLENGFLDFIVSRKELKSKVAQAIRFFM